MCNRYPSTMCSVYVLCGLVLISTIAAYELGSHSSHTPIRADCHSGSPVYEVRHELLTSAVWRVLV